VFPNPVPGGTPTLRVQNQVCLIRETKNTHSVGVPPGTGLGNTDVVDGGVFW